MTPSEIAAGLPNPSDLRTRCRGLAALEAIVCPEWEYRYYSFDPAWGTDESMASMRNGSGDQFNAVFGLGWSVVRAFDHESPLSPWGNDSGLVAPGILEGFPPELQPVITEPAFRSSGGPQTDLTFCTWNLGDGWRVGTNTNDGGATELLAVLLDPSAAAYTNFVRDYYEVEIDSVLVDHVLREKAASTELIETINPDCDLAAVLREIGKIGHPTI